MKYHYGTIGWASVKDREDERFMADYYRVVEQMPVELWRVAADYLREHVGEEKPPTKLCYLRYRYDELVRRHLPHYRRRSGTAWPLLTERQVLALVNGLGFPDMRAKTLALHGDWAEYFDPDSQS